MSRGRIGLGAVVLLGVLTSGGAALPAGKPAPRPSVDAPRSGENRPPSEPGARRRWALAGMDEMTRERMRCKERFKAPRQIEECEAQYARRYRAYNEIYIEAARQ